MNHANLFCAHGVASGEPLSDGVVIWTRVQEAADVASSFVDILPVAILPLGPLTIPVVAQ